MYLIGLKQVHISIYLIFGTDMYQKTLNFIRYESYIFIHDYFDMYYDFVKKS